MSRVTWLTRYLFPMLIGLDWSTVVRRGRATDSAVDWWRGWGVGVEGGGCTEANNNRLTSAFITTATRVNVILTNYLLVRLFTFFYALCKQWLSCVNLFHPHMSCLWLFCIYYILVLSMVTSLLCYIPVLSMVTSVLYCIPVLSMVTSVLCYIPVLSMFTSVLCYIPVLSMVISVLCRTSTCVTCMVNSILYHTFTCVVFMVNSVLYHTSTRDFYGSFTFVPYVHLYDFYD